MYVIGPRADRAFDWLTFVAVVATAVVLVRYIGSGWLW